MKNKFLIIGGIILIGILIVIFFLVNNKDITNNSQAKKCNGYNLENCDKSCNVDEDCGLTVGCDCYNKKDAEKTRYDEDGYEILYHLCGPSTGNNCFCINKTCTREVIAK